MGPTAQLTPLAVVLKPDNTSLDQSAQKAQHAAGQLSQDTCHQTELLAHEYGGLRVQNDKKENMGSSGGTLGGWVLHRWKWEQLLYTSAKSVTVLQSKPSGQANHN